MVNVYFNLIFDYRLTKDLINDRTNRTKKIKNNILAIPADAPAIPPKPKIPAIMAIITNVIVQRNIVFDFKFNV